MKKFSELYESVMSENFFSKEYTMSSNGEDEAPNEKLVYKYDKNDDGNILKFSVDLTGVEDVNSLAEEIEELILKYCEAYDWEKNELTDDSIETELSEKGVDVVLLKPNEVEDNEDLELATEVKELILNAKTLDDE